MMIPETNTGFSNASLKGGDVLNPSARNQDWIGTEGSINRRGEHIGVTIRMAGTASSARELMFEATCPHSPFLVLFSLIIVQVFHMKDFFLPCFFTKIAAESFKSDCNNTDSN